MHRLLQKLTGGNRRSIGNVAGVIHDVLKKPALFEVLFDGLAVDDPLIRMRAADAIEKISRKHPEYQLVRENYPDNQWLAQRKYILLKLKYVPKVLRPHVCKGCGACCRDFAFILLSQDDITTLENFTGLTSEEFTYNIDTVGEKRFMKFQENGDCIFLTIIDGAYSCSAYEARSMTCKGYPSTDIQREACRVNSGR